METNGYGIDGCSGGWILAAWDQSGYRWSFLDSLRGLFQEVGSSLVLIDIPIGLPTREQPFRRCDSEARRRIGKGRSSSVFSPPSGNASRSPSYSKALETNRAEVGKGFSIQAWNLVPKIREVEEFLARSPTVDLRESHPEVCFQALSGSHDMGSKHTAEGILKRMEILRRFDLDFDESLQNATNCQPLKKAKMDDYLDAAILARVAGGSLKFLPEDANPSEPKIWIPK
ncbi:MAG: DUF429 domain-containing protein [Verrucomicrobiota bacterium]